MKKIIILTLTSLSLFSQHVSATEPQPDSMKVCMSCHQINKKVVGPAFIDISKKYKGDKSAKVALMGKITKGTKGVWGTIPMPGQKLSDDELSKSVDWILSLSN